MRAALESVADFLSKYGAVDEAAQIMNVLDKAGFAVPEDSPLRLRALIGAMRMELKDFGLPVDYVMLFERLLQLYAPTPKALCRALFSSPLLLNVVVERLEATFGDISTEIFLKEREDLCRADGIYDACLLIQDSLFPDSGERQPLGAFLQAFVDVFRDSRDPKSRWAELRNKYRINEVVFRRDLLRALYVIESAVLGDTKIERAFPSTESEDAGKIAPRQMLMQKFGVGNEQLWADLSVVNSIQVAEEHARSSTTHDANARGQCLQQEEGQGARTTTVPRTDTDATASSDDDHESEHPLPPRRSRRARTIASAADADTDDVSDAASSSVASAAGRGGRRKRKRWSGEEVQALMDGYAEFGAASNVWMLIKEKHADVLRSRSNVDIKDKYRNLLKFGKIARTN